MFVFNKRRWFSIHSIAYFKHSQSLSFYFYFFIISLREKEEEKIKSIIYSIFNLISVKSILFKSLYMHTDYMYRIIMKISTIRMLIDLESI